MKKICFVVQRYGLDVNGGAELLCRQMAEKLLPFYRVDVYTTKAKDYTTWKNEFKCDKENINGVCIYRYRNLKKRDEKKLAELNISFRKEVIGNYDNEFKWIEAQGPYCPDLIESIKKNSKKYDKFIFFTYLYYTTIYGLPEVKDKSILVPTAHDEPYIYMNCMKKIFCETSAIFYMTAAEKRFVNNLFHNENVISEVGGAGIVLHSDISEAIVAELGLQQYLIYVGRLDEGKNVPQLINYFLEYKKRNPGNLKLVLVGQKFININRNKDIIELGFIDEKDKTNLEAGAFALVLPSQFESLSLVVLEAMSLEVPVICNGKCEVVKDHCVSSNAGLYYENFAEFCGIINWLKNHPKEKKKLGNNGKKYVRENYTWDKIVSKLRILIG